MDPGASGGVSLYHDGGSQDTWGFKQHIDEMFRDIGQASFVGNYVAQRIVKPAKEVESEYGLEPGSLLAGYHTSVPVVGVDPVETSGPPINAYSDVREAFNQGKVTNGTGGIIDTGEEILFPAAGPLHRPILRRNSTGKIVFESTKHDSDSWDDLPIGAVFAGGMDGELLEVVEGCNCSDCYYDDCDCIGNPFCDGYARKEGKTVHFLKLKTTTNS
jgi:hypothetical protein